MKLNLQLATSCRNARSLVRFDVETLSFRGNVDEKERISRNDERGENVSCASVERQVPRCAPSKLINIGETRQ